MDADEHFAASRCLFLFSAMLLACRKTLNTNCSSAAFLLCQLINHFTSSSTTPTASTPPLPQPHLPIRSYKERRRLLAQQPLSPPSDLSQLLLTTSRYCEVFRIHLGLIFAATSVQ